jgi:DNA-nicking Smr family endonuclease
MREANRLAADLIFKKNNGPGKPYDQIDLHELSVQEAMGRLVPYLRDRERSLRNGEYLPVKIICGRGKHSDAHGPKIGPAVVNHLHKFGYEFRDTHSEGYILVNIKKMSYKPRKPLNGK